jgi:hypothetical protein
LRNAQQKEKGASRFSVELNNWSIKPPSTLLLRVKRYAKNIPEDFAAVKKSFDPDAFLATATLRTACDVAYWLFLDLAPCLLCGPYRKSGHVVDKAFAARLVTMFRLKCRV